jgi:hypothetical protein
MNKISVYNFCLVNILSLPTIEHVFIKKDAKRCKRFSRVGGMAQMVECLLSKFEALSSNLTTTKPKRFSKFLY